MKKRRPHGDQRQDFQWENNFLDVIHIADNQRGGAIDTFRKQIEHDQTSEKNQRKLKPALPTRAPACLENDTENEGVNTGKSKWGVFWLE